jgi:hypothetical protein
MRIVDYWERMEECARRAEQSDHPILRESWQCLAGFWVSRATNKARLRNSDLTKHEKLISTSAAVLEAESCRNE